MFEFSVLKDHHIAVARDPAGLLPLTLAILGDAAAEVARQRDSASVLSTAKQELRFAADSFDVT